MTLQQVDAVLAAWQPRLSAVAENLLSLQSETAYQLLTGTGGLQQVTLTGESARRAQGALRTMNALFLHYGLLQETLTRAERLRAELPAMFGAEARLRELHRLLCTPSIEVESQEIPPLERDLLSGAAMAQRMSAEELLEAMTGTFAEVRDGIVTIGKGWETFGAEADRLDREIERLRGQKAMPTRLLTPLLDALEGQFAKTKELAQHDPLGAQGRLRQEIEPELARVEQKVRSAEALGGALGAARGRWSKLEATYAEAVAAAAEARARFGVGPDDRLASEETLEAIRHWMERLDRKRDEGALEAVTIGLRNWTAAAEGCLTQAKQVLATCEARLQRRNEVCGRFEALQVKARVRGLGDDARTAQLQRRAQELLGASPLDLGGVVAAVACFEEHVNAAHRVPAAVPGAGAR